MIDNVYVYNFSIKSNTFKSVAENAAFIGPQNYFYMKTCQRLLIISYGNNHSLRNMTQLESIKSDKYVQLKGADAYQYVLEVLCGLQSQMLGENEIVNQYKSAFALYNQIPIKQKQLTIILEKLLKDSKEIRTKYLSHIGQSGYASVAKKIFSKSNAKEVLIIGTGHLALDLLHYLKKTYAISICARNKSKLEEWQNIAPIKTIPWIDYAQIKNYSIILNTVGVPNFVLADEVFFHEWASRHHEQDRYFIDFGSPSSITAPKNEKHLFTLDDLFTHGSQIDSQKITKLEHAKRAIEQTVLNRVLWLDQKNQRDNHFSSPNCSPNIQQHSFNY